jgi:hypothetical protein
MYRTHNLPQGAEGSVRAVVSGNQGSLVSDRGLSEFALYFYPHEEAPASVLRAVASDV